MGYKVAAFTAMDSVPALPSHQTLRQACTDLAREAAREIMRIYAGDLGVRDKADKSPVTDADHAAEAIIVAGLRRLTPDTPVVREQAPALTPIPTRPEPPDGLTCCASRSHAVYSDLDIWFGREGLSVAERVQVGSSLKFCLIAEGKADIYPRFGPTNEWDTAAGQGVLEAAGGGGGATHRKPPLSRQPRFSNPPVTPPTQTAPS